MADDKQKGIRWQDQERLEQLRNKKNSNQQMTQSEDEELAKLEGTGNLVQGGAGIGNQYEDPNLADPEADNAIKTGKTSVSQTTGEDKKKK